jgi:cytochrome c553
MIETARRLPLAAVAGLLAAAWSCLPGSIAAAADQPGVANGGPPPGVENPQRAWQHWTLNCQGCHRPDGTGSEGTAPSLAGTVSKFLGVPGGREYLGRVPGVATSPLSDDDLSEVMNWMFWRFDSEHLPADFKPFTASEIGRLRARPLRLEASRMRAELLQLADGPATR